VTAEALLGVGGAYDKLLQLAAEAEPACGHVGTAKRMRIDRD
jgi:hypothetical protein